MLALNSICPRLCVSPRLSLSLSVCLSFSLSLSLSFSISLSLSLSLSVSFSLTLSFLLHVSVKHLGSCKTACNKYLHLYSYTLLLNLFLSLPLSLSLVSLPLCLLANLTVTAAPIFKTLSPAGIVPNPLVVDPPNLDLHKPRLHPLLQEAFESSHEAHAEGHRITPGQSRFEGCGKEFHCLWVST